MAGEATLKLRTHDPVDFTCADGTGIEKGTLLKLTTPRTASATTGTGNEFLAGIAAREKIANDGRTQIAVFRRGIFDMYCSGAITAGDQVCACIGTTFPNYVASGSILTSGAAVLGTALESGAAGSVVEIDVSIGMGRANR